jgi:hypothetical protein
MLGGNAMNLWDFDAAALRAVADRSGLTVEEVATPIDFGDFPETFSWSLARPVPLASQA